MNNSGPTQIPYRIPVIEAVEIEELFGIYRYELKSQTVEGDELQLMILYGDNGSGKSTILRLLYHLLNPERGRGHRTFVGSIPFKKLRVVLSNGFQVTAIRQEASDLTSYNVQFGMGGLDDQGFSWRDRGLDQLVADPSYGKYCTLLRDFGIQIHYLSDNRQTIRLEHKRTPRTHAEIYGDYLREGSSESLTSAAINQTLHWLNREAIKATNVGQSSVNAMYVDLIKRVASDDSIGAGLAEGDPQMRAKLAEMLAKLFKRNSEYVQYGLTAPLEVRRIAEALQSAPDHNLDLLRKVVIPYVEGHTARLDALKNVQQLVHTFVCLLSDFYADKTVTLKVGGSFKLQNSAGAELKPDLLSSGEKQLMLLLCNAIIARSPGAVLIIDEPEISLNMKWQRKLVESLKECMQGMSGQIILATHSFEILAGHDYAVCKLKNQTASGS